MQTVRGRPLALYVVLLVTVIAAAGIWVAWGWEAALAVLFIGVGCAALFSKKRR